VRTTIRLLAPTMVRARSTASWISTVKVSHDR
jgi:hypothetical protein